MPDQYPPPPARDCGVLLGGPGDGDHVHTTDAQNRYGLIVWAVSVPPTPAQLAAGTAPAVLEEQYLLRYRRDDGTLVWVHSAMINAAARRPPAEGGGDG